MKVSDTGNFRSVGGKVVMGLIFAAIAGAMYLTPAQADDGRERGHNDNRRYDNRGHGNGHGRDHYRGRRVYRTYGYVEPVYVAPPVYYAPPPAPGISIFLPTIHIR